MMLDGGWTLVSSLALYFMSAFILSKQLSILVQDAKDVNLTPKNLHERKMSYGGG